MAQASRELVCNTLTFNNPERVPRDLWSLPCVEREHPGCVQQIQALFPSDIVTAPAINSPSKKSKGDCFEQGIFVDEWGCVFENIHYGVIGEVKEPLLSDIADWKSFEPPYEILPSDYGKAVDEINRFCESTDRFVKTACFPRPWERLQFIRGTENAMIDVMMPEDGAAGLLRKIHDFYMKELEIWVKSDVDAIMFMDDWGTQKQLLIPPRVWRDLFKPLYKDYCDLAKAYDKFVFMHSDGCIIEVYEDLIEIGVTALNSQLFCMDMAELAKIAKGKITFWGEIDRQHVLPSTNPEDGRNAVRKVVEYLYSPEGGVIAQFELGPGAVPETATAIFDEWNKYTKSSSV